jgi:tripartite-type tricarboxylate transporter receptor subunit TctC
MKFPRRTFLRVAAGAAALPVVARIAWAQTYPTRPVRAVVAFAPGGVTDTFARLMAQRLTEQLGKQVYVENIAGASGNIGTAHVAKAAPDGYTILFAFSSHVVNPTLFARVPYDPIKDFDPVTLAVASTTVLTVNPSVPAKTVKELVDLVKANPGKFSFGSAGAGTQAHLAGEQFRLSLGLDLVHVPFGCPCRKLKHEHIGGVVRREPPTKARALLAGHRVETARPSSTTDECEPRCSTFGTN